MIGMNIRLNDSENKKVEELKVKFRLKNKEDTVRKIIRLFKIKEETKGDK